MLHPRSYSDFIFIQLPDFVLPTDLIVFLPVYTNVILEIATKNTGMKIKYQSSSLLQFKVFFCFSSVSS